VKVQEAGMGRVGVTSRGLSAFAVVATVAGVVAGFAGGCGDDRPPSVRAVDQAPVAETRLVLPVYPKPILILPLPAVPPVDSAPAAAPGSTVALSAGVEVDARLLVIGANGTSATLDAIRSTLDYLGTPYDVLDASAGPAPTAASLASGNHGKYQGIILDAGGLEVPSGSAFSDAAWAALTSYEAAFGVRRLSLYTAPSASYGLSPAGAGVDAAAAPVAAQCTPAGAAVFVGANCASPVTIDRGFVYPATALDGATTPLLVDGAGHVLAASRTGGDGRETLALTFGQSASAVFSLELAYGLVDWVTNGLFIGERHVYAAPQVDDLFLASTIYTGGTYRITDADLQAFADWLNARRSKPTTQAFRVAFAANGSGSASRPNDPLTAKAVALGTTFPWINHSWDHPVLDSLSYAAVFTEFMHNDAYLKMIGVQPYSSAQAVTPNLSGLGSINAMQAMYDFGIRAVVSDDSAVGEGNPSPNAGILNALVPGVLEIPRHPTELYFNVSQPAEWEPEYAVLRKAALGYDAIIDSESSTLLLYLLRGDTDPWMFHQANLRDHGGGHSLLGDLLDATFDKYAAVATFPVVSPQMEDLAEVVAERMSLNASGVVATIQPGAQITVSVAQAATVPVTGLCAAGAVSYAGQPISYVKLAAGQSVTLPLGATCPTAGTGGPGPDPTGSGGTSGAGGPGTTGGGGAAGAGESSDAGGANGGATGPDGGLPVGRGVYTLPIVGCACTAAPAAGGGPGAGLLAGLLVALGARRRRR
jgi:MYXO-CTERM domain-containing protein